MPIENPTALVEEFKKSGEFESIRRELLLEFQRDESYAAFQGRIEDIVRQRLAKAQMLHYLPQEMVQKELNQEVERYPIVERAVADVRMFSDATFLANIEGSLQKILTEEKQGTKFATVSEPIPQLEKDEDTNAEQEETRTTISQSVVDDPAASEKTGPDNQQDAKSAADESIVSSIPPPDLPRVPSPGPPPAPEAPHQTLNLVGEEMPGSAEANLPVPPIVEAPAVQDIDSPQKTPLDDQDMDVDDD